MRDLDALLNSLVNIDRNSLIAILFSEVEAAQRGFLPPLRLLAFRVPQLVRPGPTRRTARLEGAANSRVHLGIRRRQAATGRPVNV